MSGEITMKMVAQEVLRILPKPLLPGGSAEIRIPDDDFDLPLDDFSDRYLKAVAWKLACAWPHKPPSGYRCRTEAVFNGLRLIVSSNTINSARLEECFFELEKA